MAEKLNLRVGTNAQEVLGYIQRRAREFHWNAQQPLVHAHCQAAVATAMDVKLIDSRVLDDPTASEERKDLNALLALILYYHMVDIGKFERLVAPELRSLAELCDPTIHSELLAFGDLVELGRRKMEARVMLDAHAALLNGLGANKRPPFALLGMLVDRAITHPADGFGGLFIDPTGGSSIFRFYKSEDEANEGVRNGALADEIVFAPIAELFAYPSLAARILQNAYEVNHHDIFELVMAHSNDPTFIRIHELTVEAVEMVMSKISAEFDKRSLHATVSCRDKKHPGKQMGKVRRKILEDFNATNSSLIMTAEEYVARHLGSFDFSRFSDHVARRLIMDRFNGEPVDIANIKDFERLAGITIFKQDVGLLLSALTPSPALKEALGGVIAALEQMEQEYGSLTGRIDYKVVINAKPNGYYAIHVDVTAERLLKFEIQIKTPKWHAMAEEGGAAHCLYLGGDPEFLGTIKALYQGILHQFNGGSVAGGKSQIVQR